MALKNGSQVYYILWSTPTTGSSRLESSLVFSRVACVVCRVASRVVWRACGGRVCGVQSQSVSRWRIHHVSTTVSHG
jgi:hypothetical protein